MGKTLKELRGELLENDGVRAAYDEMAPAFQVARAIIQARRRSGLSQAELAERMRTSQSYIARLESGTTLPTMRTFFRVAEATGMRPEIGFGPSKERPARRAAGKKAA